MNKYIFSFVFSSIWISTFSQSVTIDPSAGASAIIDARSTSKGLLPPRMSTAERTAISNPAEGMVVFDTTVQALFVYGKTGFNKVKAEPEPTVIEGIPEGPIAANDRYLIVGNPSNNNNAGNVAIFRLVNDAWVFQNYLTANDSNPGARFGSAVDISGNRIAIAASNDLLKGAVYIFEMVNGTWLQRNKITASNGSSGDQFGYSIDLDGSNLMAGAPGVDTQQNQNVGRVYAFRRTTVLGNPVWFESIIESPNPTIDKGFGRKVALNGTDLLIGAPFTITGIADILGVAYLYKFENNVWTPKIPIYDNSNTSGSRVGEALAITDSLILVGLTGVETNSVLGSISVLGINGYTTLIYNPELINGRFPESLAAYRNHILAIHTKNSFQRELYLVEANDKQVNYLMKINGQETGPQFISDYLAITSEYIFYFTSNFINPAQLNYIKYK